MCNNIILIGFMGSGKTTIGRKLAQRLKQILIDTDSLIEVNYGMKISDFFKNFDEEKFREIERNLCIWCQKNLDNAIISTGGGMPTIYDMKNLGKVIFLDTPFNEIKNRILNDGVENRPLIKDIDSIQMLYDKRLQIYKNMADYSVNTLDSKENIVDKIYHYLKG
ncbi:shikimate kinase [Helicobacter sp. MIT 99-5507]|uniref:shikimate kinase n=1 Tax=Helicobacter sp. MIT 99-5507 TaxID=152489 RepID=UPI000E1FAC38|nr:shikimate kinase [Helicobacter sp. MIT 99-5507]RDU57577.1 shikimate kinase [Helicobacter sp. MIT 99-5507]